MKLYFIKNWVGGYASRDDMTRWHRSRTDRRVYSTGDRAEAVTRAASIRRGPRQFGDLDKCRVVSVDT